MGTENKIIGVVAFLAGLITGASWPAIHKFGKEKIPEIKRALTPVDKKFDAWKEEIDLKIKSMEDYTRDWADVERKEIKKWLEETRKKLEKEIKEQKEKTGKNLNDIKKTLDKDVKGIRKDLEKIAGKKR